MCYTYFYLQFLIEVVDTRDSSNVFYVNNAVCTHIVSDFSETRFYFHSAEFVIINIEIHMTRKCKAGLCASEPKSMSLNTKWAESRPDVRQRKVARARIRNCNVFLFYDQR